MVTIPGVDPIFMWIGFILLVLVFLFLDLGVFNKRQHEISVKEALVWTFVWFLMAVLFNIFIWLEFGQQKGLEFLTGYIIEKSLSVDNLFVILLIFTSFHIKGKYQHRILFWGILGALIMRGLMIWLGTTLIAKWWWILYIFGAFLIYAGIKIFTKKEETYDPHHTFIVRFIKKIVPVSKEHSERFFIREKGKFAVTLSFVALIVIELTDVVFALDSIPAIFAITLDPFIVFTSNVFAILGLRSLYFVIKKAHDAFHYLNYGLGVILVYVGIKLLLVHTFHIPTFVSLGVVIGILTISVFASIMHKPKH